MKKLLLFISLITGPFLFCQDGSPDSSFGDNGIVLREFDAFDFSISSSIELQNGNILLSASTYGDFYTKFLMQIDPEGNPVPSFGIDGVLVLPDELEVIYIHNQISENEFIVFGNNSAITTENNALFKIDNEASVILNYGDDGALTITDSNFFKTKYEVLENGHVIIAKYNNDNTVTITRFDQDGVADVNFPEVTTPITTEGQVDRLESLKITDDEKILIGLRNTDAENISHSMYRFNSDGSLDITFNNNSYVLFEEPDYDSDSSNFSITYTPIQNGEIIVSGRIFHWEGGLTESRLYKIKENGDLSISFGNAGVIQINNYAGGIYQQPNGNLLFQGINSDFEGGLEFTLKRFYNDGNTDSSFNFQSNYNELGAYQVLHHSNGKIYVLGSDIWYNSPPMNFIMLRYNNSPLGVEENDLDDVIIAPNPSNAIFDIHFSSKFLGTSNYTVYDTKGLLLMSGKFNQSTSKLDLSSLNSGIYFFNLDNKTYRLIKK